MRVVLVCLYLIIALTPLRANDAQSGQMGWGMPELNQAWDALGQKDCYQAWELAWPLAKAGNSTARYFLAVAFVHGVIPPGGFAVQGSEGDVLVGAPHWHSIVLLAYGAFVRWGAEIGPSKVFLDHARKDLVNGMKFMGQGREARAVQCYEKQSPLETCRRIAVADVVIPTFEEYAHIVEMRAQENNKPATCRPRGW